MFKKVVGKYKDQQKELDRQKAEWEAGAPQRQQELDTYNQNKVAADTEQAKLDRQKARAEGKQYAEDVLNRDVQGLDPKKRQIMQYEANKQIQRGLQSANRKMMGDQSMRGITPKSGVAYAQQKDMQRLANEAQGAANRDIESLDADMALKKLAAMFNIEQGEASQAQLDKQMAADDLRMENERKRQKEYEDRFYNNYARI